MHADLERLISLHDLDVMIKDLGRADLLQQEVQLGLSPDAAIAELKGMRNQLASTVGKRWLALCNQICVRYDNAVVPVVMLRCSGCLTRLPTAVYSADDRNEQVRTCSTCGRIIYWAD
jgi:predicted  nucleic acid-binding Zn-ribbon protein